MTPDEITRLRTLCTAATPGPWRAEKYSDHSHGAQICTPNGEYVAHFEGSAICISSNPKHCWERTKWKATCDAKFVAAARTAIPALLDEIERLRAAPKDAPITFQDGGMSLRDYFAGQALAGMLANSTNHANGEQFAAMSYGVADAMLKARGLNNE